MIPVHLKNYFSTSGWLLCLLLFSAVACSQDNEEELFADEVCLTDEVTFSGFIKPLIDSNCSSCHNAGFASGNVRLDTYSTLKQSIESGRFLGSIQHSPGFSPMPNGGPKLSDCDIEKIERWIDEGLPQN